MPRKGYKQTEQHKRNISQSMASLWKDEIKRNKRTAKKELKELLYQKFIKINDNGD